MTPGGNRTNALRVITAVIALYAFVLQGFLGGLMPVPIGVDGHVLCLSGAAASPADSGQSKQTAHSHPDCCIAAHIAATAVAPRIDPAVVPWPRRLTVATSYAADSGAGPRAPPGTIPRPRGPPSV